VAGVIPPTCFCVVEELTVPESNKLEKLLDVDTWYSKPVRGASPDCRVCVHDNRAVVESTIATVAFGRFRGSDWAVVKTSVHAVNPDRPRLFPRRILAR